MKNKDIVSTQAPSLIKLGACAIYEALTIVALSFVCALVYVLIVGDATYGVKRYLLQLFLWLSVGLYFIWCWMKTGQTLAMQAWRLKLMNQQGNLLSWKVALARYVLATFGLMLFGIGFLWAVVDRNHLFLHDRILRCRINSTKV